jgi:hypothetical protein
LNWQKIYRWYATGGNECVADYLQCMDLSDFDAKAPPPKTPWLRDRRNARRIPHRLEACGYAAIRNEGSLDVRWKLNGRNQVLYGRATMSIRDRYAEALRLTGAR